jgi:biopolymer transport protein TolR
MLIEKRSGRRLMNQINVVPYVDVMLVLLVIFMITAPLINPGQVELPSISKTSDPPAQPMEVSIRTDGTLWLRDRARSMEERRVSRNQLIAAIRQKQKQNPEQAVVIAADKDVRYESVLEVMDMLQQNQVRKVGLLAKPRSPSLK